MKKIYFLNMIGPRNPCQLKVLSLSAAGNSNKLYLLFIIVAVSLLISCSQKTVTPIRVIEYGRIDATENKNLLILLRGLGGDAEDFEKYGIIAEIKKRELPFDIVVPDAHFGYYKSETIEERLKYDIIDPARKKGYRQIWLAGFSMGGLGSLFYIRSHARDVDGVILTSPFMGWGSSWFGLRRAILPEIRKAGGIASWLPNGDAEKHWQDLIWTWVKEYTLTPDGFPPIYLGYGSDDSLATYGPALLSEALNPGRVFSVPGNHDYETFQNIWKIHLDRLEPKLKKSIYNR